MVANYTLTDNVWIRIGPLPLLAIFLGLITLITINFSWYINQDATPGWITSVCVINVLFSLLFMGIMLYIFQSAGSYVTSKIGSRPTVGQYGPMSIGMSALNTTRVFLLAIGLFILFVSSTLFAVQKEAQETPSDQTSYFAAIVSGILISIGGFLLLISSYNELLQYR